MTRESTLSQTAIRRQFDEMGDALTRETTVYLIGGGAMTLRNLKNATKDVDLVVETAPESTRLHDALVSVGYRFPDDLRAEYDDLGAAFILQKDRRRFDVFQKQVAGVLMLSEGMKERSERLLKTGELSVRLVSLDDIFLFKAVANRDDDFDDMVTLAQAGLNDDVILSEVERQLDLLGTDHFIGAMNRKFERLAEEGFQFDIHSQVAEFNQRVQTAERVTRCIEVLAETEYSDDLYTGVPLQRIRQRLGTDEAKTGLEWLERLDKLERHADESVSVSGR
jgi:predicted nucleotidyltransferase